MSTKVTFTTRKVDHGGEKLKETIAALAKSDPHVRVGIFADAGTGGATRDGGLTNVEIAAIHEFGAPEANIPERSFIRSTFEANKPKYAGMVKKLLPQVVEGKRDVRWMFDVIGQQIVADINRKVRVEGVPPPLKPETIARKGSSRALLDTGRMLASLTYLTVVANDKQAAT